MGVATVRCQCPLAPLWRPSGAPRRGSLWRPPGGAHARSLADGRTPSLRLRSRSGQRLDMEERYGSVALDVIGKAVFNYEFGSVNEESPVVQAAIRTLGEVEHRALTPAPFAAETLNS